MQWMTFNYQISLINSKNDVRYIPGGWLLHDGKLIYAIYSDQKAWVWIHGAINSVANACDFELYYASREIAFADLKGALS